MIMLRGQRNYALEENDNFCGIVETFAYLPKEVKENKIFYVEKLSLFYKSRGYYIRKNDNWLLIGEQSLNELSKKGLEKKLNLKIEDKIEMKTTKEKIEIMKAFDNGEDIQYSILYSSSNIWFDITNKNFSQWNWSSEDYRIKPKEFDFDASKITEGTTTTVDLNELNEFVLSKKKGKIQISEKQAKEMLEYILSTFPSPFYIDKKLIIDSWKGCGFIKSEPDGKNQTESKEKVKLYKWAIKINGKWSETRHFYKDSTDLYEYYDHVTIEKYQMLEKFIWDENNE